MEETKKRPAFIEAIIKFFRSKVVKGIIGALLLTLSLVIMLLMDSSNFARDKIIKLLGLPNTGNYIQVFFFDVLGIGEFNVSMSSWLLFSAVFILAFTFFVGSIWKRNFVNALLKKRIARDGEFTEEKQLKRAKRLYGFYWYLILLGVGLVLIAGAVCVAIFGTSENITLGSVDLDLFINLGYTLLIALAIIVLVPVAVMLVYYTVIRFVFWLVGAAGGVICGFYRSSKKEQGIIDDKTVTLDASGAVSEITGKKYKANEKDMLFSLARIDEDYEEFTQEPVTPDITLEEFILQFQSYAINNHKIYYELPILRAFVAGLSSSRLIILEGLSGTGKSMLPRMFSEFTGCHSFFAPVQATWRDKSDMLGYYSEFTKIFKVTDFLKNLYTASYYNEMNMMVLDEMNLSRIEYYFADFLSILEYPKEDWRVKLIEPESGQKLPVKLNNGYVQIPANTWFIGTANTDDSTFTITDKVYDRAFVIDFKERFAPIASDYNSEKCPIDAAALEAMFEAAKEEESYQLTNADMEKFLKICDFVRDRFDIRFGNRIMVQINNFVPVYVAMGGKKEEALDLMFARKILRKLNGMYDDYIKDALIEFKALLNSTYGKGVFTETEKFVDKVIKRLV